MRSWTGCGPARVLPMPSTVVTTIDSTEQSGARHAFTERCTSSPLPPTSSPETMTVHAPQPPSPHPSFAPVSPRPRRRYSNSVVSGPHTAGSTDTRSLLTKKVHIVLLQLRCAKSGRFVTLNNNHLLKLVEYAVIQDNEKHTSISGARSDVAHVVGDDLTSRVFPKLSHISSEPHGWSWAYYKYDCKTHTK